MDLQLAGIIFIFVVLFIMEQFDKKEGFFNPSPFLEPGYNPVPYSVNFPPKETNFGNFGTFGSYPPNPLCPSCHLSTDAVSAPYLHANDLGDQEGDQYGKVARKCDGLGGKNYDDLSKPFLVAGRSAGRPRQCRRLV